MPTVRIPINLSWSGATGSPGVNVWHGRITVVEGPTPDLEDLAEWLETFYTSMASAYPTGTLIQFLGEAQGVGDDEGNTYLADPWSVSGSGAGGFLPPATQMFVNWRALTGGRSGRGRTFIGPLQAGVAQADGTPTTAYRDALANAASALIESSDSFDNGALGIYSRTQNTFRDFVLSEVPDMFASLRSRRD